MGRQFRSPQINRAAYQALAIQLATDGQYQCQSAPVDQPSTTHFIFNTISSGNFYKPESWIEKCEILSSIYDSDKFQISHLLGLFIMHKIR